MISPAETPAENIKPSSPATSPFSKRDKFRHPVDEEGYAVWYVVPEDSLARRRAPKDEYTAAHNHLPLGARVRVTHLANGKSVIVRITDRGITNKRDTIDLCREAAADLGMLSEGKARVRIEELPEDKRVGDNSAPDSKASADHP
jgi:rare lipoprotein A